MLDTASSSAVVATDRGPSTATNVAVSDPLPAGVTAFSWSSSNGSSGTGTLSEDRKSTRLNSSHSHTSYAVICLSATGSVTNTVSVTAANDTNPANNTATDTDALTPRNDVGVTQTDGVTADLPETHSFPTRRSSDLGPSTATNVAVSDPLPAGVTAFSWSSSNGSSGTGTLS